MNDAKIYLTTNPDSPFHWLKKDLDDNSDVNLFNFNLDDNPRLSESVKEYLKRQHKGLWYKRYILGEWVLAEGAIFDFFEEKLHVIDTIQGSSSYYIVGADIGSENPTAYIMLGYSPSATPRIWVEKEYYHDKHKNSRAKAPSELAYDLLHFIGNYLVKAVYVDPSAEAFTQEVKKCSSSFQLKSPPIKHADNDVINGIHFLQSLFMSGDLKVKRGNLNLIREIQSYVWDPKKAEKGVDAPVKRFDHAIDALRYGVYSHFGKKGSLDEKTKEEKELERLEKYRAQNSFWSPNYQHTPYDSGYAAGFRTF